MLKVIFYLKSEKVYKNGECSIFARITYKTNRVSLSTGKTISKERWIYTNNLRNLLRLEKEKILKNYLELYRLNVEKKFNHLFMALAFEAKRLIPLSKRQDVKNTSFLPRKLASRKRLTTLFLASAFEAKRLIPLPKRQDVKNTSLLHCNLTAKKNLTTFF